MKTLFLSIMLVLILSTEAHAYPVLYDLWGQTTTDGKGKLVGSYIYDPVSNTFYDWNLAAVYTELPDYSYYTTVPQVTIKLRPDRSVTFSLGTYGTIQVGDVSGGFMPLY